MLIGNAINMVRANVNHHAMNEFVFRNACICGKNAPSDVLVMCTNNMLRVV